jgi:hypothetical protein
VIGLALVTNVRGLADNLARRDRLTLEQRMKRALSPGYQPRSPEARARNLRIVGILFAVAGPIAIVGGAISISHGHGGTSGMPALPTPFRYLFIAVTVVAIGQWWLPQRGMFRQAARRGGWRLAIALIGSLGALIFGVLTSLGEWTIGIAAWLIGGLLSLTLWMDGMPRPPQSDNMLD